MPTPTEVQIGIEIIDQDPFAGEDEIWIRQDKYESTTPEHWETLPVSYFARKGVNRLVFQKDDLPTDSIFRQLAGEAQIKDEEHLVVLSNLQVHLRSDGLFVWSNPKSKGVSIPVVSVATYAPDSVSLSSSSEQLESLPALRLDLIPDSDATEMAEDGFAPSLLFHVLPAPDPEGETGVAEQSSEESRKGMDTTVQDFLSALARCQEQIPNDDQGDDLDMDGDGDDIERRLRLPVIHAGSNVGGAAAGGGGADQVRIPGLENFSGWVTSENVHEVMRQQGIAVDGEGTDRDGSAALGPGAGSRRARIEVDGENAEDEERVTIWQRTEAP